MLGKGGMSRVYKVSLPVIGKIAALKVLHPHPTLREMIGDTRLRNLFIEEARMLGALRHPHIAEIWLFGEAEGRPYYLMDYYGNSVGTLIGESYRVEAPSRKLPTDWSLRYARQTLEGLECLHDAGLVHRDIKPDNLLLTDTDHVKICDFGLSKFRGESFPAPPHLKVGSPGYAAPEQEASPDSVDGRADLYSVGVVLYRMITGRLPEDRAGADTSLLPSENDGTSDRRWGDFFHKALHRKTDRRFSSAGRMLSALADLENAWKRRQRFLCRTASPAEWAGTAETAPQPLRWQCRKVLARNAADAFQTGPLMRPRRYVRNRYRVIDDARVEDTATGRMWQRGGTPYPVTWPEANRYVQKLNREMADGFSDWRLPTVEELLSLLDPPAAEGAWCVEPVFEKRQNRLWSCDRRSFTSAWMVSVDIGFLAWQDMSGYDYARAVRTASKASHPPPPSGEGP